MTLIFSYTVIITKKARIINHMAKISEKILCNILHMDVNVSKKRAPAEIRPGTRLNSINSGKPIQSNYSKRNRELSVENLSYSSTSESSQQVESSSFSQQQMGS